MTSPPTMKDVARAAGVAVSTVSRYVNGRPNLDPLLAERVSEAIDRLGYRRNLAAASIRPGWTSRTLGLVISDVANPYYAALTRAIETCARDRGYLVIGASSDEDGDRHDALVDRLMEQRVDGMLIVPPRRRGRAWSEVGPPIPPVVFLDRPEDLAGADVVLADNEGGAHEAVRTLLAGGARHAAFVGDDRGIHTIGERLRGYRRALDEAGVPHDPALELTRAHDVHQAAEAVAALLSTTGADAVFAANNRSSIGALLAFRSAGRRVPLIGFDDFEAATISEPPVSVVSQDVAEMGRRAVELLLARLRERRLRDGDGDRATHVLPTRLVLRGSERR